VVKSAPDLVDVHTGARMRARRRKLHLTQKELAAALGVTFQQVHKYERGSNRLTSSMLAKAAAKLETTIGALVGDKVDVDPTVVLGEEQRNDPVALALLKAYGDIENADTRRHLLGVAIAMARAARLNAATLPHSGGNSQSSERPNGGPGE
jgi:transcriptional regulator with XRE-family HTH domain